MSPFPSPPTRRTYNSPDTVWYKASDKLEQFFHNHFNAHVEHFKLV